MALSEIDIWVILICILKMKALNLMMLKISLARTLFEVARLKIESQRAKGFSLTLSAKR